MFKFYHVINVIIVIKERGTIVKAISLVVQSPLLLPNPIFKAEMEQSVGTSVSTRSMVGFITDYRSENDMTALSRNLTCMVFAKKDEGDVSCIDRTMKPVMIEELLPFAERKTYPLFRTEDSALLAILL